MTLCRRNRPIATCTRRTTSFALLKNIRAPFVPPRRVSITRYSIYAMFMFCHRRMDLKMEVVDSSEVAIDSFNSVEDYFQTLSSLCVYPWSFLSTTPDSTSASRVLRRSNQTHLSWFTTVNSYTVLRATLQSVEGMEPGLSFRI